MSARLTLTSEDISKMLYELTLNRYYRGEEIAKRFGVCRTTLYNLERKVKRGKRVVEDVPVEKPRQVRSKGKRDECPKTNWLTPVT